MIYADYNGSAPLCKEVQEFLLNRIQEGPFSNPNAIHPAGRRIMFAMENARRTLAKQLACKPNQIIFNSGSSEGITQIFHSVLGSAPQNDRNIIVTSGIEHSAIVHACSDFQTKGYDTITLKTTPEGVVDLEDLKEVLTKNAKHIALVTVMAANNETGVIQPFQEIGKLAHEYGIPYFSDTTQFIGKTDFQFDNSHMDFAVLSAHKVGALIGSGLIIARDPAQLSPLIYGGGQEKGFRGGTQNYIGIETMAVAMDSFEANKTRLKEVQALREKFEENIKEQYPQVKIIGENSPRLATTTLIALPGISGQEVQAELEEQEVYVTTSSACSDKKAEASRVLTSMKVDPQVGTGVVRISLCSHATMEDYQAIETALLNAYKKLSEEK